MPAYPFEFETAACLALRITAEVPRHLRAIPIAATRPRAPSEPHMCAECEDDAEREIVLDTARGGAYYSILRQARKRLSESRGAEPRRREP